MNKVAVFGDACTDVFVYGSSDRLCPEAPVPILIPQKIEENDGMALNVVRNLESLGVTCVSVTNDKSLIVKKRFVEDSINQMLLRVDTESKLSPLQFSDISLDAFQCAFAVVSDYNKGFINEQTAKTISSKFSVSFLDTKRQLGEWANGFSFIKINEVEYKRTLPTITSDLNDKLIVTLGRNGCMYKGVIYPPPNVAHTVNVCGAGDTFLAGLIVEYIKSNNIMKAIEYALLCSSDVVQSKGVAIPFTKVKP
jgi:D-beta-D-heptose 7-phosphate kinase/D-beta-D-heptose 1-phosphate adenosyltransferase